MLGDSIQGEKALRLLQLNGFPSDNRFGPGFFDGNEAGEDEAITGFEDGHICAPTRRYPYSWLGESLMPSLSSPRCRLS